MAEFDIIQYLAEKGYHGRRSSGPEVTYPCFFDCNEPADSRKRKLYVNTADNVYFCFVCNAAGGVKSLREHFGDDALDIPIADTWTRRQVLSIAANAAAGWLSYNEELYLYLTTERGLTDETIHESRLGWVDENWSLVECLPVKFDREAIHDSGLVWKEGPRKGQDYFYRHLLIPYVRHGSVVQIRGRAMGEHKGGKYATPQGDDVLLYNADDLAGAEDVIVVEGEFDCLVLKQHLLNSPDPKLQKIAVVALPGTNAKPADFEALLADAKRIYLAFDSDAEGVKAGAKYKELLGVRARILEWPADLIERAAADGLKKLDWTEAFVRYSWSWRDVEALLASATGKRIFTVGEAGHAFYRQADTTPGLATGYAMLDATIAPGVKPGQVFIALAKTGTGKTIYLCNLGYNMRERRLLFVSLEMTKEEVFERLERIYRFYHPHASTEEIYAAYSNLAICDENKMDEAGLHGLIEEYEAEYGAPPEALLIDYLGYFARGVRGGSPYEKTSNAVMLLKAIAKGDYGNGRRGPRAAIFVPHQVNRAVKEGQTLSMDDARDSGVVEETGDFVVSLFRPDDGLTAGEHQPDYKFRMQLLKSRHGGKGKVFTLQMAPLSLAMVDDFTEDAKRAARETYRFWRGLTYPELRRELTAPVQMRMEVS